MAMALEVNEPEEGREVAEMQRFRGRVDAKVHSAWTIQMLANAHARCLRDEISMCQRVDDVRQAASRGSRGGRQTTPRAFG